MIRHYLCLFFVAFYFLYLTVTTQTQRELLENNEVA